ncbi:hypothetical protein EDE15_4205 [Edaphobacter aggregans]|uniref:Uncharacterized protein n=1 Tax=Edaphobacter aggregans TaxID=570835 RepID=A0A3R9R5P7_9BACT|nr:hypothetical protein [Edaphobacter aggregans]RSL18615.1 hypothetical protein EDE15_4205 [Edaphobacter aggregans]
MPRSRRYLIPSTGESYTAAKVKKLSIEQQTEVMRHWFEDRYIAPDELPYDSGEGGIQWIGSGPYNADQQLRQEFDEVASGEAIAKLSSDLGDLHYEWAKRPDASEYDTEEMSDWIASVDPFFALMTGLSDIEETTKRKRTVRDGKILHRLLFANVVTSLETYLGDAFTKVLLSREDLLFHFYRTNQRFREFDPQPPDTEPTEQHMRTIVENFMAWNIWHRMTRTARVYKDALGIELPADLGIIGPAIGFRHDIVHRNGKSAAGVVGTWGIAEILALTEAVSGLATDIQKKIDKLSPKVSTIDDGGFVQI